MSVLAAEWLRVIGQWLDSQEADQAELRYTETTVEVRWQLATGEETRTFAFAELQRLGQQARRQHKHPFGQTDSRWAGALRTLGQELEDGNIEPLVLRSLAGGVQVFGTQNGAPYERWHALEGLSESNRLKRNQSGLAALRPPSSTLGDLRGRLSRTFGKRQPPTS
jgi:hypothetical protein